MLWTEYHELTPASAHGPLVTIKTLSYVFLLLPFSSIIFLFFTHFWANFTHTAAGDDHDQILTFDALYEMASRRSGFCLCAPDQTTASLELVSRG